MTSVRARIRDAAPRNAQLLQTLDETNHAHSALEFNESYVARLRAQIHKKKQELEQASKIVESELADYEKYENSQIRRLAYKVGQKEQIFDEKTEKEKREWEEALKYHDEIKYNLGKMLDTLDNAVKLSLSLAQEAAANDVAKKDLDELYKSIFSGETPELPGEDKKEQLVTEAETSFNAVQSRMSTENEAWKALKDAERDLALALNNLSSAKHPVVSDFWNYGSFVDMSKDSKLGNAHRNISEVKNHIAMAREIQPLIHSIENLDAPELRFMGEMAFNHSEKWCKTRIQDALKLLTDATVLRPIAPSAAKPTFAHSSA
ncbi:hypothetical protein HYFRA_00010859 [Hymenoscyphus fraxineus]|uniref:Uncharacterized protein n=1 Tax=Hymenoscyphus fraxineus TaxID=746836 RepID=A0A9N9KW15_9HELO|nr:hypothetical protein HYFRA_00010859 [Hymenoscyphus fraxineus]